MIASNIFLKSADEIITIVAKYVGVKCYGLTLKWLLLSLTALNCLNSNLGYIQALAIGKNLLF